MWTQEQRNIFAKEFILTAKLYDKEIGIDLAKMIIEAIEDLNFEECRKALKIYIADPKYKTWPRPADIRSISNPYLENTDQGKLIAAKIYEAIGKFGYSNYLQAMEFIGETGKEAVNKFGGWSLICEQVGPIIQPSTFMAQMRDLVTVMIKEKQTGNNLNQLEYKPENNLKISEGLEAAKDLLQNLTIKKL